MITKEDYRMIFTLPPDQAVTYLRSKRIVVTERWNELEARAYNQAFTSAGVLRADILTMLQESLADNLGKGETLQDWLNQLKERLANYGVVNETIESEKVNKDGTTTKIQTKFTPHRLKNIYRTNLQTAYNGGRLSKQLDLVDKRPYFFFNSVSDGRRSDVCTKLARLLAGKVVHYSHPILKTSYTPLHFSCRSSWSSLSAFAVDKRGLTVYDGKIDFEPAQGFNKTPLDEYEPDVTKYPAKVQKQYKDFLTQRREELDRRLANRK